MAPVGQRASHIHCSVMYITRLNNKCPATRRSISTSGTHRFGSLLICFDSSRYFAEIHDGPKSLEQKTKPHICTTQKSIFRVDPFVLNYPSQASVPCGLHLLFQPRFPRLAKEKVS